MQDLKLDANQAVRTAMWKYRSGLSNKNILRAKDVATAESPGQHKIQALWQVASPLVESWSQQFLTRRFH